MSGIYKRFTNEREEQRKKGEGMKEWKEGKEGKKGRKERKRKRRKAFYFLIKSKLLASLLNCFTF